MNTPFYDCLVVQEKTSGIAAEIDSGAQKTPPPQLNLGGTCGTHCYLSVEPGVETPPPHILLPFHWASSQQPLGTVQERD